MIKWKYIESINHWEGTLPGDKEPTLFIEGGLCVTDLRETRVSKTFVQPKHYKVIGLTLDEAKQLAEDLVTGMNFSKHEENRLAWIAEHEKSAKVLKDVEELLKTLKNDK
jgi:hypothetical protein